MNPCFVHGSSCNTFQDALYVCCVLPVMLYASHVSIALSYSCPASFCVCSVRAVVALVLLELLCC